MRRLVSGFVAFVTAFWGLAAVAPAAQAAEAAEAVPFPVPGQEVVVGCGNAEVAIQVVWAADAVSLRYRLHDTAADGRSPVLRISAVTGDGGSAAHVFDDGTVTRVRADGEGLGPWGGEDDWDPGTVGAVDHLRVEVADGTPAEGTRCTQHADLYDWSRLGLRQALEKEGAPYSETGGDGPAYDCSGLVHASYAEVAGFPGWPVRSSEAMYDWARTHPGQGRVYAQEVPYSELQAGDLIFYDVDGEFTGNVTHVAFYAGDGNVFDVHRTGVPVGLHADWVNFRVAAYRILGAVERDS
ncbi:C40 family peptidase [Promicromonospora sp. NPDC019610]|uniref:C40 family peptidase n=1 Tax=Promicromonospora sp. NPDC019610 TaxID=3364405 RepID=UPI0037A64F90